VKWSGVINYLNTVITDIYDLTAVQTHSHAQRPGSQQAQGAALRVEKMQVELAIELSFELRDSLVDEN